MRGAALAIGLCSSVVLAAVASAQVVLVGVSGNSVSTGRVPALVLLPDGRLIDGLELVENFLAMGFGRDEILVHDLSQGTYSRLRDLEERFATLDARRTELTRLAYDPATGVLDPYDDVVPASQTPSEFLATAGTLVIWRADAAGLLPLPDNCPHLENPLQLDAGGVGVGSAPDGTGDACQCGDVTVDGFATPNDVSAMREHLAGISVLHGAALGKCPVAGATPACDILTVSVLERALGGRGPSVMQVCPAAVP